MRFCLQTVQCSILKSQRKRDPLFFYLNHTQKTNTGLKHFHVARKRSKTLVYIDCKSENAVSKVPPMPGIPAERDTLLLNACSSQANMYYSSFSTHPPTLQGVLPVFVGVRNYSPLSVLPYPFSPVLPDKKLPRFYRCV